VTAPKRASRTRPQNRAIGYIRVSAVGGRAGPDYHTLDIQRASIGRVCEARGFELTDMVHTGAPRALTLHRPTAFA
jgi:hypothetical protein